MLLWLAIAFNAVVAIVPFRFDPPNLVQNRLESQQQGALVFRPPSMARTMSGPAWIDDAKRTGTLTITLKVVPAVAAQEGPARILTISKNYRSRNILLGQQGADLIVRMRRPGSNADGRPSFVVPGVFAANRARNITVSIRPGWLSVRIDGETRLRRALQIDALGNWNSTYRLALGNEVIGRRAWNGVIQRAIVVTPHFRDDLLAPGRLEVPQQWWQVPDRLRQNPFHVQLPESGIVALLHLLAFVPIGYAAARLAAKRGRYRWVAVMVFVLGVLIETSKVLFAGRHILVLNILANIAGGLVGMVFARRQARLNTDARLDASSSPEE